MVPRPPASDLHTAFCPWVPGGAAPETGDPRPAGVLPRPRWPAALPLMELGVFVQNLIKKLTPYLRISWLVRGRA